MNSPTLPRSDAPTLRDLVPLSDGRPGLRTTMHVEIHEPAVGEVRNPESSIQDPGSGAQHPASGIQHPETPVLDFISSDESLDRYGEVIAAAGWDLASYQRNPVFQNAHQYGDIIFTLGRALVTEVRTSPLPSDGRGIKGEGSSTSDLRLQTLDSHSSRSPSSVLRSPFLFQRIQFATDVNPMAKIAYGLYRGKFLSAVSVGFIPLRWQDGDAAARSTTLDLRPETLDCVRIPNPESRTLQFRRRYLAQELLEVSAVAIPANPNALALGLKSGAVEKSDLQDLSDLLRHTLASPRPPTDLGSPTPDFRHQTRDFLRRLHSILRS